ncbi:Peptidase A1 [Macleaya cordata]|uniref:Peptidase A1 n=1 Tax=Macleaya cordata TaxID=56857 RepID=A0A200Q3U0_MACCD|nr:Peptidase A1 [Macleaya cordata]
MILMMGFNLIFFLSILILLLVFVNEVSANGGVFHVKHKFAGQARSLKDFKVHDSNRHGRFLAGVDFPLGGDGQPTGTGLYFTKIGIGYPSKDYFVHVDTGSDILWVNCIQCDQCPKSSGLGVDLKLYDPDRSLNGRIVYCDDKFCTALNKGPISGCLSGMLCSYSLQYGDGSGTAGYFVNDVIGFDQVSGNLQTTSGNASVTFGCGVKQTGNLIQSSEALDGILGFGNSSSSMISQLASSGVVKKKFAHCLDSNGGGIFAIGNVVQPKVNTTPLVLDQAHYNVNMEAVKVGNTVLQLPKEVFETGNGKGTIVDSGTTLSYFPAAIYEPLLSMITSSQNLSLHTVEDVFSCFEFGKSVDEAFPTVTFQFENSLELMVYPHEYLFPLNEKQWCIGWQNSGSLSKDVKDTILLGGLDYRNKINKSYSDVL